MIQISKALCLLVLHHGNVEEGLLLELTLLTSLALEVVEGHLQVVLADYLLESLSTFLFDRSELASFCAFSITELNLLFRLCRLLPAASIVSFVEINKEEWVQEVHECVAFIEFEVPVDW